MARKEKKWFLLRVGKRVYRNNKCTCLDCQKIAKEGLIINDKQHARYLYTVQSDFMPEMDLDYRDVL